MPKICNVFNILFQIVLDIIMDIVFIVMTITIFWMILVDKLRQKSKIVKYTILKILVPNAKMDIYYMITPATEWIQFTIVKKKYFLKKENVYCAKQDFILIKIRINV